jgi:hypothetical protein
MDFASRLSFSEAVPQATNAWHSYSRQVAKSLSAENLGKLSAAVLSTLSHQFSLVVSLPLTSLVLVMIDKRKDVDAGQHEPEQFRTPLCQLTRTIRTPRG